MQTLSVLSDEHRRHYLGLVFGLLATFSLTAICYWPSLDGPFLFDDIPNLEPMGERGGLIAAEQYLEFIATPRSGPLGRPLSLASFTLNAKTWPADPRPFRITNLVIHLVNGFLIFLFARRVFSMSQHRLTAEKLALMCAAMWLLHPLLVSTTAYIVQRMTMLCALFSLAGLLCYMRGRDQLPTNPTRGWLWIIGGMSGFGLLALLSKESAILLPLYALTIEWTVYSAITTSPRHRNLLLAILIAPVLIFATVVVARWDSIASGFEFRSFTLLERLMTQAVVVVDYLGQIVAPRLSGLGIIHDDFPVSTGLTSPFSTLISLLLIVLLAALAVAVRKKLPLVSLGVLWFLAGHSLEAGPFPLELYFEHRNYLPLLGPLIVAASLLLLVKHKVQRILLFGVALFILAESLITWQSATTWGSEARFMRTALIEHPDSLRAQQFYVNELIVSGQYSDALSAQEYLAGKLPGHTSTLLSILNLRCLLNTLTAQHVNELLQQVSGSNHDLQIVAYLPVLTHNAFAGTCSAFGPTELHALFDGLSGNPKIATNATAMGAILYNKGIAYSKSGELDRAILQLDLSYKANSLIDIPIQQTVWLLEAKRPRDAAQYLSLARQHGREQFIRRSYRDSVLEQLQQAIDRQLSGR